MCVCVYVCVYCVGVHKCVLTHLSVYDVHIVVCMCGSVIHACFMTLCCLPACAYTYMCVPVCAQVQVCTCAWSCAYETIPSPSPALLAFPGTSPEVTVCVY